MNEFLFFFHIIFVLGLSWVFLKLGKSALTAWICLQAVLANLFVLKQMVFLGFHITCSDVFAIGSILGLNLLREYFGKPSAKKALFACFFSMISFVIMAQIHLFYTPSPFDTTHDHYRQILFDSPRLLAASLFAFFIVQQLDLRFFNYLKTKSSKLSFAFRNLICLIISQSLDTLLFSFLGLWGLVFSIWDIVFVSFAIKLVIISVSSPLVALSRRLIPLREEVQQ